MPAGGADAAAACLPAPVPPISMRPAPGGNPFVVPQKEDVFAMRKQEKLAKAEERARLQVSRCPTSPSLSGSSSLALPYCRQASSPGPQLPQLLAIPGTRAMSAACPSASAPTQSAAASRAHDTPDALPIRLLRGRTYLQRNTSQTVPAFCLLIPKTEYLS